MSDKLVPHTGVCYMCCPATPVAELQIPRDLSDEMRETAAQLNRDVDELVVLAIRGWLRPIHRYFDFGGGSGE